MIDDRNGSEIQLLLAANLRRMRIARHLSLSGLAREMGVSKATLSGIESGRSNPTVETLAGLAHALGVSIGELLQQPPAGEDERHERDSGDAETRHWLHWRVARELRRHKR